MAHNPSRHVIGAFFILLIALFALISHTSAHSASVIYGVQDTHSRNSQLFRLDLDTGDAEPLGPVHNQYDIEAMEIHPRSGTLYAIAGGGGNQDGNLYRVDKDNGDLTLLGNTDTGGADEIVSAAFHPDGTLWVFQENVGLLTVDLDDGHSTVEWYVEGDGIGGNWEGLAWDADGEYLYGSQGSRLYRWSASDGATVICHNMPRPTEALDFRSDGTLFGGWHYATDEALRIFEIDIDHCTFEGTDYHIPYNDVESIAFEMGHDHEPSPTPTPTPEPPTGTDKLTAQVFVDFDCDGTFQPNIDRPLADVRVKVTFSNGSYRTLRTTSFGSAYFAGIDASDGVTVKVRLPRQYKGYGVRACHNSSTKIDIPAGEFEPGVINHKQVNFSAELWGEMASH